MTVRIKEVNNTVYGLVGVVGVQRGKDQVTGFSKGNRVIHGFTRTNLTNQDDVGCLTQGIFQGDFKRVGINAHFTLGNDTARMFMNKFNRVFNGNDMTF